VAKTIAEMFREEGDLRTLQWTLLELIKEKFEAVPVAARKLIKTTTDPKQLRLWLKRFARARTVDDMRIGPPSPNEVRPEPRMRRRMIDDDIRDQQDTVLDLIKGEFGSVPAATRKEIRATTNSKRLTQWVLRAIFATISGSREDWLAVLDPEQHRPFPTRTSITRHP
jgi:hypothetical protein